MTRTLVLALLLATLMGCGRVGAPVRRQPAPPPNAAAETEEDEKEKK